MIRRLAQRATIVFLLSFSWHATAEAGQWTNGGMFDPQRNIGVNFLRFLAEPGEGQMTVRCDSVEGVWIDVGAAGNGELPAGVERGDRIDVVLDFVRPDGTESIATAGPILVRVDGAVLIELVGDAAAQIAPLLLIPSERLDITIAGETRAIPLEGVSDRAAILAGGCDRWPVPGSLQVVQAPPGPATLQTVDAQVSIFVEEMAAGLPSFIVATANACFTETTALLTPAEQDILRGAPDFVAGVNAVVAANPAAADALFPALDACGGTIVVGELMWFWVQADWAHAGEAEQIALGSCLIGAVDRLTLNAKLGIMRFQAGDFADAIDAMLAERVYLGGTIVEDLIACGARTEPEDEH